MLSVEQKNKYNIERESTQVKIFFMNKKHYV